MAGNRIKRKGFNVAVRKRIVKAAQAASGRIIKARSGRGGRTDGRPLSSAVRPKPQNRKSVFKGANQLRDEAASPKRLALGRGLSALMSATPVRIDAPQGLPQAGSGLADVVEFRSHGAAQPNEGQGDENGEGSFSRNSILNASVGWSEGSMVRVHEPSFSSTPLVKTVPTPMPVASNADQSVDTEIGEGLQFLPLFRIHSNPSQPRRHFVEAEIEELAQSIRESGVLQPVIVRPDGEGFEIVAGERRFRAAQRAGLMRIPALVRKLSDKETLQLAIVENIQRTDLNPIEEAEAYQRLIEEFGETQSGVAEMVGKDRVSVANSLRLLKLQPEVRSLLISGELSAGHGRALLMVEDPVAQVSLAERVVSERLSVREVEAVAAGKEDISSLATTRGTKAKHLAAPRSPLELALEDRLRQGLGTKVTVHLTRSGTGEIRINFFSNDELESLLERLGV